MMKTRIFGLFGVLLSVAFLTSCEKDDDLHLSDVPAAVMDSFVAEYPGASRAEWEKKNGYVVAEFRQNGQEVQVWYDSTDRWVMTEYDLGINLTALPQAVQTAFQNSQYATWFVDDIDLFERPDDVFYVIDVETKGQPERNLYFSPDGQLLKDEVDRGNDDVRPDVIF